MKTFPRRTRSFFVFSSSVALALGAASALLFAAYVVSDLPSPGQLQDRRVSQSTKIFDRKGMLLYEIYADQNRTPVNIESLPQSPKQLAR